MASELIIVPRLTPADPEGRNFVVRVSDSTIALASYGINSFKVIQLANDFGEIVGCLITWRPPQQASEPDQS
ncbi:MAG: hypothetical protein C0483_14150 [Pirellula sp.]|nr:hypothetical protein [Pirellula sp.]